MIDPAEPPQDLAVNDLVNAEVLVVEGWVGPDALREFLPLVRAGADRLVVTTGEWVRLRGERIGESSYAALARQSSIERGLEADDVIAVPTPDSAQDRTYLSAVKGGMWARDQTGPPRKLDVLSGGVHSRRTRLMYQLEFGDNATVGIRSA